MSVWADIADDRRLHSGKTEREVRGHRIQQY